VHLLRELEKVDMHNDSDEWRAFAKKLRRLIGDGVRLRKRADYTPQRYASRVGRIDNEKRVRTILYAYKTSSYRRFIASFACRKTLYS